MSQVSRDISILAADGFSLAATLYGGDQPGPVTIIAPATAVPARYYVRFANFLAEHGRPALTFDYRGQGRSAPADLKGFPARFRDWGVLDMPGMIEWAHDTYADRPLHWVGHSYGGFGAGLAHNNARIDRLFGFASMSADLRFMAPSVRYGVRPKFFVGTLIARTLGYLPAGLVGTEALPRDVMLEWYRFCTTEGFLFGIDDLPEVRHFATLKAAVQLSYAEDDTWVTRAGVEHLLARITDHPDRTVWPISSAEAGGRPIGHMGFFRPGFSRTLWTKALAWLDQK